MTEVRTKAIEIFYSYAHKDERLCNELDNHHLAATYMRQSKYETAKLFLKRSLAIFEKTFGPDNINVAEALETYANALRVTKQNKEAAELETRAKKIRDKHTQENEIESNNEEKARLIYNADDFFLS